MPIKTIFFGSPDFALPTLNTLRNSPEIDLRAALTQPDKPAGRGKRLTPTPVKALALEFSLDCLQPASLKDETVLPWLRHYQPDVIVVVAYGGFVPKSIRELPKYGCVNLHPSLLPKYRGAAPMQWAILNGETMTGNSTMYLAKGWDSGDIIYQEIEPILPTDTYGSLSARLAEKGAALIVKSLIDIDLGVAPRIPQSDDDATFAPLLQNEDAKIQWRRPAKAIHDQVRGLNPVPASFTLYQNERWKILRTEVIHEPSREPGRLITTQFNTIRVAAADAVVEILELQPAGGKPMTAAQFLRGRKLIDGVKFD
ncbi:MAG: methionyl-tRNA formyltransferase [Candidatus Omnitrophota bacterium]|jgi:methionyl-tRNA formyltransferase|nr:MAG: methionyl-tRNA formyltransferase [Candidatus Omnitrophota bacterium]